MTLCDATRVRAVCDVGRQSNTLVVENRWKHKNGRVQTPSVFVRCCFFGSVYFLLREKKGPGKSHSNKYINLSLLLLNFHLPSASVRGIYLISAVIGVGHQSGNTASSRHICSTALPVCSWPSCYRHRCLLYVVSFDGKFHGGSACLEQMGWG